MVRQWIKQTKHDDKIELIFEYLKQLEETKQHQLEQENRKQIGFKTLKEDKSLLYGE